ncbi:Olfactory receptor 2L2 [Heterocephalus glaber]|uniref:Olfactory receptor 2L2 n=1 Tax=Heterocephalus glaber TaxID=10181 RepID=G5BRJ1_HETGA|nr:Olfactory receptor 2L2 [Heterocephalus glaber]
MGLAGNMCMVLLILLDAQLHTPMYFLLTQLSLVDLIYICFTVPNMASGFLFGNKSISFIGAINHFFCDIPAMLNLACEDTWVYEYIAFFSTVFYLLFPFMVILGRYGKVLLTVYCMHTQECRKKAYATCSAHLTVVTFYIAPFAYTYLRPKSFQSPAEDKVLAVFYTILTPVFNPVIYSLRNKEVLGSLRRVTQKIYSFKM